MKSYFLTQVLVQLTLAGLILSSKISKTTAESISNTEQAAKYVGPIRICPEIENNPEATDEDLNACIASVVQELRPRFPAGIPEINLPPLDPFKFNKFNFEQGGNSAVRIKAIFTNVLIKHLTNFEKIEFKIYSKEKILTFHLKIPNVRIDGDYELDGNILYLAIGGTGPYWMDIDNLTVNGNSKLTIIHNNTTTKSSTKSSSIIQSDKVNCDLQIGKIRLELMNLFNGNKILGPVINNVLNENALDLYEEIKPQFTLQLNEIIASIANGVLKQLPFLTDFIQ